MSEQGKAGRKGSECCCWLILERGHASHNDPKEQESSARQGTKKTLVCEGKRSPRKEIRGKVGGLQKQKCAREWTESRAARGQRWGKLENML